jgi:hypothetical protein
MINPLKDFQSTVFGPHIKMPWAIRLRNTLTFIQNHPQYTLQIGIIPDGQNAFFINSSVCAKFFGLKNRNSLNRNLKQHGFILDKNFNIIEQFRTLCPQLIPVSRCWGKRFFAFGDFNWQSSKTQVERASNNAQQIRNRNRNRNQNQNSQIAKHSQTPTVTFASQTLSSVNRPDSVDSANTSGTQFGGLIASDDFTLESDQIEEIWLSLDDLD